MFHMLDHLADPQRVSLGLFGALAVVSVVAGARALWRQSRRPRTGPGAPAETFLERINHPLDNVRLSLAEERAFQVVVRQFAAGSSGLRFR